MSDLLFRQVLGARYSSERLDSRPDTPATQSTKAARSFTWLGGEHCSAALRLEKRVGVRETSLVRRRTYFRNEDRRYPHDVYCQLPRSNACTLNIGIATSKNGNACIDTSSPKLAALVRVFVPSAICATTIADGSSPLTDGRFEVAGSVTRQVNHHSVQGRE